MKRYLLLLPLLLLGGWVAQLPVSAPSFTGIGDVSATGIQGHYGSVAFSAASRGSNMYQICDVIAYGCSGGTTKDIKTDATTGLVSSTQGVGTIATCGTGGNQCYISQAYDDSGNGFTANSFGNNNPLFVVNAIGTLPAMGCVADNSTRLYANAFTRTAGPNYTIFTYNSTSTPGSASYATSYETTVNTFFNSSGTILGYQRGGPFFTASVTISAATTYALIEGDDGAAAGHIFVNGTDHTGTVGTGLNGDGSFIWCPPTLSNTGFTTELAFYNADLNAGGFVSGMNTALHTNSGF
jgi:hypothetical protein